MKTVLIVLLVVCSIAYGAPDIDIIGLRVYDDNDRVLAEGKFIVAEGTVPATVRIENRYHPGSTDPYNQVNYIAVTVNAPFEYRADDRTGVIHSDITVVDIIKNWNI